MRRRPVITAEAILAVLGVVAFTTGVTKRWILDPLGDAFAELSPNGKAAVAVLVVAGVAGSIAFTRLRQRSRVTAARRVVESQLGA